MNAKKADKVVTWIITILSFIVVFILGSFIFYILAKGVKMLNLNCITSAPKTTSSGGGIGPELFNSFYMLIISLFITVPIGLGAAIYLAEYSREGSIVKFIRLSLETMSSLPSIVIGMFGLLIFVNMLGWGYSIIAGALSVSLLNIPSMTRISEDAIKAASKQVKEASLGLGATKWQTIVKLTLPVAISEIITGILLAAGRIFGDEVADRVINGSPVEMPDNTAATIWMRIEDAAGIRNDEDEGEADWKIWAVIALKVFGTFLMLVLIASVIWYIWEHATRI